MKSITWQFGSHGNGDMIYGSYYDKLESGRGYHILHQNREKCEKIPVGNSNNPIGYVITTLHSFKKTERFSKKSFQERAERFLQSISN